MWQWLLGGIVIGLIIGVSVVVIHKFWDSIAEWLHNTAADAVGRVLGYNAKTHMHRAVTRITKLHDKVQNMATILFKKNELDTMYQEVTYQTDAPVYQIDTDVIKAIEQEGSIMNEFIYKQEI